MQKRNSSNANKKYLKKQFVLLIIIIIYLLSITFIFGRYVLKKVNTHFSSSKEFYFYSDKLKEDSENKEHKITWNGEECIIPISLYTEMNSLKKLSRNINYEVECTVEGEVECELQELESIEDNKVKGTGTVLGFEENGTNTDNFKIKITKKEEITASDEILITVVVKTTGDFEETLKGTFNLVLQDETGVTTKIDDVNGRAYFNLIVSNMTSDQQQITLSFNQDLLIDTTNEIFSNLIGYEVVSEGNPQIIKVIFKLDSKSNIDIKFYKTNRENNYTSSGAVTVSY